MYHGIKLWVSWVSNYWICNSPFGEKLQILITYGLLPPGNQWAPSRFQSVRPPRLCRAIGGTQRGSAPRGTGCPAAAHPGTTLSPPWSRRAQCAPSRSNQGQVKQAHELLRHPRTFSIWPQEQGINNKLMSSKRWWIEVEKTWKLKIMLFHFCCDYSLLKYQARHTSLSEPSKMGYFSPTADVGKTERGHSPWPVGVNCAPLERISKTSTKL
jgi:hypothetical protein